MWRGFAPGFANNKKGALDSKPQVYLLLAHGWWFSSVTLPPLKLFSMIYVKYC